MKWYSYSYSIVHPIEYEYEYEEPKGIGMRCSKMWVKKMGVSPGFQDRTTFVENRG